MQIISKKHLRGNVNEFTISHKSKKLGKVNITLNSTTEDYATFKAWSLISKMYKEKRKIK